jgi:hypothetical protein
MKHVSKTAIALGTLLLPLVAFAQTQTPISQFALRFSHIIIDPIIALLFGVGLLVFVFGVAEFFFEFNVRGKESSKEAGKQHMLWGVIGMFVMVSAVAILQLISNTVAQFQ